MTDIIANIAITAALVFGFALACVITVVYLLSKRQINVTQNNSTSVTSAAHTDSGPGFGIQRFVIKWAFILLVAGVAIATLLNAVADAGRTVTNALQTSPAISAPVAQPDPVLQPTAVVEHVEQPAINPLHIAIAGLSIAAAYLWGSIAVTVIKHHSAPRAASREQREQRLEDILPDAVNQL